MRTALPLFALLTLAGCHRVCGSWAPIWVMADCAVLPVGDTADSALPECDFTLDVAVDGGAVAVASAGEQVALTATLRNVSGTDQSFTVYEPCPDDLVAFSGLGEGYDYYDSCLAGDCPDSGDPVTYTVSAGDALSVATAIDLGGGSCNEAVEPGEYVLSGELPLTEAAQPMICAVPARLTVQ